MYLPQRRCEPHDNVYKQKYWQTEADTGTNFESGWESKLFSANQIFRCKNGMYLETGKQDTCTKYFTVYLFTNRTLECFLVMFALLQILQAQT